MAAAFRRALPSGVIITNTGTLNISPDLDFTGGLKGLPSSILVVKAADATGLLTSVRGTSTVQVVVMRSAYAMRDCFDTGDGRSGIRTVEVDGTVVDRGQGFVGPNGDILPPTDSADADNANTSIFTVLVYRPDGTRVQMDLQQNRPAAQVLTLDELAAVASTAGLDIDPFTSEDSPGGTVSDTPITSPAPASR